MFSIKSREPSNFENTNFNSPEFDPADFDYLPKPNLMLFAPTVKSTSGPRIFNFGGLTTGVDITS
jgi:hypothetical protein